MLKKFIQTALLLVVLCTTATTYAQIGQSPEGIQFQALATDANGHPAAGRVIYVKDAIVAKTATGTIVYSETFKVTASSAGIFTIVLGKGTYASGVSSIANIDWANGPFFLNLKIAVEPTVPTASWNVNNEYVDLGTSQFWSVPYALYAGNVKGADGKLNTSDTAAMLKPYFTSINLKANIESPTFTGTVSGITKAMVGLGNVDNTADINKPVSTATQTALDLKANATDVTTALALKANAADVTAALALKANTADVTAALDLKVDKVTGKALSTNDYTTAEKTKLAAITGTNTGDQDLSALAIAADVNSAIALKANTSDVNAALALKANAANVASSLALKANITDLNNALIAKADVVAVNNAVAALNGLLNTKADNAVVTNQLGTKEDKLNKSVNVTLDAASDAKYPSVKAVKTYVDAQVAGATIADASATEKGKIQLAGDLAGTAAAPTVPGLALKENLTNKSTDVTTDAASDTKYPSVKAVKTYVDAQVAGATIADASATEKGKIQLAGDLAGTAAAPTVPGLALKAPIASPTFTGTVTTGTINTGTLSSTSITAPTYASTPIALTYSGSNINWNPAQGLNAAITLTQNSGLNFTAAPPVGSYGTVVLTQDATGSRTISLPTIAGATNKVLGSTSTSTVALSTVANAKDILNFYFDGTSCYWNIGQGYGAAATTGTTNLSTSVNGTLAVANGGTGATTASAALTSLGAAPIASPTFTGTVSTGALSSTSITAPTYASTPIALTYTGSNINWNPAQGLNAAITLTQNSGLNFTAAPPVGSYGTVVLTQDATGSRTISLPTIASATNKVLGSTSTSTVALSTVANSKDILNFYFDGTSCYWNIGQGYGAAATTGTTNLATSVNGTLAVANGGTGANSLTANSVLLGNGTSALQVVAPGTTGNVLTSNGTTWTSTAPAASGVPYTGATGAVNLGAYDLTVNGLTVGKGKKDAGTAYQYNTALGVSALNSFTGGTKNTALGYNALSAVTSTDQNIAIGVNAMGSTTDYFQQSVAVGNQALQYNKGSFNTALGSNALSSSSLTSAATYLVGVGALALWNNTSGQNNTAVGSYALSTNTTGNNNTALGQGADVTSNNLSNATAIGYDAKVSASNTIQLGNTSVTTVKTSGAITAPIYASTPQTLTDAATISWNPANGLNANVTLGGNRTLSFSTAPASGSYGTLVVTQDGAGSRTLTLPTATNKVLGSSSTTTIALSTTASAIDIVNFYYDGSNYFWNVGQGYGTAATSSTPNLTTGVTGTLAVANGGTGVTTLTGYVKGAGTATMTASATIPVADITGTLPVANGGTGAATLTGLIKGNGTSAMTAATAGTDYQAPIVLTTTGTGAATLSGTTLNIPSVSTVRLNSDEFTATAAQTSFTLTQTALNAKVFMFINGTRIKNGAFSVSGTTVTYTAANNNSYALVAGDRIQFDYAY